MRLIDADAFKEYIRKGTEENVDIIPKRLVDTVLDIMDAIMLDIDEQPTIEAEPVKHGWWDVVDFEEPRRWGCSECYVLSWDTSRYCPRCGAKMEGER